MLITAQTNHLVPQQPRPHPLLILLISTTGGDVGNGSGTGEGGAIGEADSDAGGGGGDYFQFFSEEFGIYYFHNPEVRYRRSGFFFFDLRRSWGNTAVALIWTMGIPAASLPPTNPFHTPWVWMRESQSLPRRFSPLSNPTNPSHTPLFRGKQTGETVWRPPANAVIFREEEEEAAEVDGGGDAGRLVYYPPLILAGEEPDFEVTDRLVAATLRCEAGAGVPVSIWVYEWLCGWV